MSKKTALYDSHLALSGRMVDFGGWQMPVQYTGVMDEHNACRKAVGLFDVSHMGEVFVIGKDAEAFLNELVSNDVSKLQVKQAQYTVMCHSTGGIVDDLVIYRRSPENFLLVVNAANTDKDFAHIQKVESQWKASHSGCDLTIQNKSDQFSQIAIQGRLAEKILQKFSSVNLTPIKTYWFDEGMFSGKIPTIFARTGYTGEDGFELYVPWSSGPEVWSALLEHGKEFGLKPCGLGARDTLRLEMKYPLYGHELGDETNPLEAGVGWVVKLGKSGFVGKTPIENTKAAGLKKKLVGFEIKGRGIPRQGYSIFDPTQSKKIGEVTSGTQSPSLSKPIGIAYVDTEFSENGRELFIEIRDQKIPLVIVPTPFYKRDY